MLYVKENSLEVVILLILILILSYQLTIKKNNLHY